MPERTSETGRICRLHAREDTEACEGSGGLQAKRKLDRADLQVTRKQGLQASDGLRVYRLRRKLDRGGLEVTCQRGK